MTIKFDNIYIKDRVVGGGPFIKDGPISKYLDFNYDDFLDGEKSYEDCEIKELERVVNIIKERNNIDLVISSDLSNQLMISNAVNKRIGLPYLGLYNACASFNGEILVAASLLKNRNIKDVLITTSSHNLTSERNFRYPTEYGSLKKEYQTFTVTSQTGMLLSKEKTNLKIEYCTIGRVMDYGIKDSNDMGSVMAPAAAYTLYEHLKDTNRSLYNKLKIANKQNNHILNMIPRLEDETLKKQLNEIYDSVSKIISTISKHPDKAKKDDNFFDYYLPITVKLIDRYDEIENQKLSSKESEKFFDSTNKMIDEINRAYKKILSDLYRKDIVDMDAEMKVFDSLLKADGFNDSDLQVKKEEC